MQKPFVVRMEWVIDKGGGRGGDGSKETGAISRQALIVIPVDVRAHAGGRLVSWRTR